MKINYKILILSILICLSAGIIGSLFTTSNIDTWYASLQKPFFSPPNWIFAPVWTMLYVLMGVSVYFIYENKSKLKLDALKIFGIQLFLNAIWSIIFFGLHKLFFAFTDILLIDIFVVLTMVKFYKIDKKAAYLLIPYLIWILFATVLNFYVWILSVSFS